VVGRFSPLLQEDTMSDLPKSVHIYEQGPREGFQIEKGPIPTARKIELVEALSLNEKGSSHRGRMARGKHRGASAAGTNHAGRDAARAAREGAVRGLTASATFAPRLSPRRFHGIL
jgi:hypothetical protein